jgi:phosphoserine aminotransferase
MSRAVFNFSPGPALIPEPVLRQAADELLDWHGTGTSIMEMSHRGKDFMGVHAEAIADLRTLLSIPKNYRVLFMQGGALAENAIVPLNLMGRTGQADYLVTGQWSAKSLKEARRYGQVNVVADSADAQGAYRTITPQSEWRCSAQAAYLHVCTNETIDGVEFHHDIAQGDGPGQVPAGVPIVSDVSSHILSRPMDVSRFGMLYGGAQKNVGPAGLTLVIIREDLLGHAHPLCPSAFNYQVVADNDSMFNTPPTFGIYLAGLVFKWILAQGGLEPMARLNAAKAALLYQTIDDSGLYENRIDRAHRSFMNVSFFLRDERLNDAFLEAAKDAGLVALKGHRVVGGMRASIYNAMPLEGVQALTQFMREFERTRA